MSRIRCMSDIRRCPDKLKPTLYTAAEANIELCQMIYDGIETLHYELHYQPDDFTREILKQFQDGRAALRELYAAAIGLYGLIDDLREADGKPA